MKLDLEKIKIINFFEKVTGVEAKDCFEYNNKMVFLVPEDKLFLAVGKNGQKVEKISALLKRKIKVVVYSKDPVKFIKSFVSPIKPQEVKIQDSTIIIKVDNVTERAILIGRNSQNLKALRETLKKYYKEVSNIIIE